MHLFCANLESLHVLLLLGAVFYKTLILLIGGIFSFSIFLLISSLFVLSNLGRKMLVSINTCGFVSIPLPFYFCFLYIGFLLLDFYTFRLFCLFGLLTLWSWHNFFSIPNFLCSGKYFIWCHYSYAFGLMLCGTSFIILLFSTCTCH